MRALLGLDIDFGNIGDIGPELSEEEEDAQSYAPVDILADKDQIDPDAEADAEEEGEDSTEGQGALAQGAFLPPLWNGSKIADANRPIRSSG